MGSRAPGGEEEEPETPERQGKPVSAVESWQKPPQAFSVKVVEQRTGKGRPTPPRRSCCCSIWTLDALEVGHGGGAGGQNLTWAWCGFPLQGTLLSEWTPLVCVQPKALVASASG